MRPIWQVDETDLAEYTKTNLMTWNHIAEAAHIVTHQDVTGEILLSMEDSLNQHN